MSAVHAALAHLVEIADIAPKPNCSCHIAPPCADCVEWAGLREAIAEARETLSKHPEETGA